MRIATYYEGPTNTRGSRIVATHKRRQKSTPYDHALNADDNHKAAACNLYRKLEPTHVYITKCEVVYTIASSRAVEVLGYHKKETTL